MASFLVELREPIVIVPMYAVKKTKSDIKKWDPFNSKKISFLVFKLQNKNVSFRKVKFNFIFNFVNTKKIKCYNNTKKQGGQAEELEDITNRSLDRSYFFWTFYKLLIIIFIIIQFTSLLQGFWVLIFIFTKAFYNFSIYFR